MAIKSNKSNLKGMQSVTKAALLHVASTKDHNLHYLNCPLCPDSWCKYNKDRAKTTTICKPGPGLLMSVMWKLRPIFEELRFTEMLT